MMNNRDRKISFLGGGICTTVLIERLISSEFVSRNNILVSDVNPEKLAHLKEKYGIQVTQKNDEAAEFGDFVFFVVPPSQVKPVLSENCKTIRSDQVLISLTSAIPLWIFESILCKNVAIVRILPDIPSLTDNGVIPYCIGKYLSERQVKDVDELLSVLGCGVKIDDSKMNIATAITEIAKTSMSQTINALKEFAISKGMDDEEAIKIISKVKLGMTDLGNDSRKNQLNLTVQNGTRTIDEEGMKELLIKAAEGAFLNISNATIELTQ